MIEPMSLDRWCRVAQECVLLAMLAAAPWAFGAEEPVFHSALLVGVALLTLLAGVRLLLAGGPRWRDCPIVAALAGLFLLTAFQLLPLPPAVLNVLSPKSLEFYRDLLPERPEMLPGDATP